MRRLISFFFLLLFALTPLIISPFSSELFELPKMYFTYALTGLLLGLHLLSALNQKTPLYKPHPLNFPLLLFLVSQIISFFFSIDRYTSFFGYYGRFNGGLLSTICYITLFFILNAHQNSSLNKKIIKVSIFSSFLVCLYAIAQSFGIDKSLWQQDAQLRVFSTLGQPNWLSAYLLIIFFLSLNFIKNIYLFIFISTFELISIFLTKSQSGLLSLSVCGTIFFCLSFFYSKKLFPQIRFLYLVFIFLSLLFFLPKRPTAPATTSPSGEVLNITDSKDIRFNYLWPGALSIFKKSPIIGTGPETFAYTYYWVRPATHNLTSEWNFLYNKAHNEFLNLLANTGLFGLSTYLFFIILVFCLLLKSKSFDLLTAFISILITNFFGFSISIVALYFFLLPLLSEKNS